jgi:hypothetical protein
VNAQVKFSLATDVSLLRNFSPKQKFWAFGQSVQTNFHFNKKETAYAWLVYHNAGKFKNDFSANAKSLSTTPSSINYKVQGKWRFREFSLGWKHYFKGSFDAETGWSFYSIAGFGLLFAEVENTTKQNIDTVLYDITTTPKIGIAQFKRLTIDLGIGGEIPLGGNFFIYGDVRTYIPGSDYPSPYLHSNKNVPLPLTANLGLRILFDLDY